jgi:hypothetical protein
MLLTHRRRAAPWLLALGLAVTLPARAGAPLQTEDAGALDAGQCEFEAAAERTRSGGIRTRAGGAGMACGLADGLQLGVALARSRSEGERADEAALGAKWRVAGQADGDWQLTLAVALARARAAGEGWRRSGEAATLVLTHAAGPGALHAALTHEHDAVDRTGTTAWGLAWEADALPAAGLGWAPMAEWVGDDRGGRAWGLGLRVTVLPDRLWLDAGAGRSLRADAEGLRDRRARVGLKWAF